jgi:hypothetical protein
MMDFNPNQNTNANFLQDIFDSSFGDVSMIEDPEKEIAKRENNSIGENK